MLAAVDEPSAGGVEPFSRYSAAEREAIFLAGGERAETLRKAQLDWKAAKGRSEACTDTPNWDNHSGKTCADYATEYCDGGSFRVGAEWTGGMQFNQPELHCCSCGKPSVVDYDAMQGMRNQSDLHALTEVRIAACTARTRRQQPGPLLLHFHRLPRSGNAFLCFILGACSKAQSRSACLAAEGADPSALAEVCPGGAADPYLHYGGERLPASSHNMCAGLDGVTAVCSTFDGDQTKTCGYMRSLQLPATVMVQHERFSPLEPLPCSWPVPPVRMLVMLRDPGERAQSAYTFGLEHCICAFKQTWCKMYTSFRFSQRRAVLCDGRSGRHPFATGVSLLRSFAGRDFPAATADPMQILGRYTTNVVREVYAPYFGSYRLSDMSPWLSSNLLARLTLSHCFTWVGIVEQMPLSLELLKAELPQFFRNLDTKHIRARWEASSSKPGTAGAANRSHPYLRSHLLANDYEIYDTELARLLRRASKAGITVVSAAPTSE